MSRCARWPLMLMLALALALLTACKPTKEQALEETLKSYHSTIRWGEIEQALVFVAPEHLRAHPLSALDRERYRQVQISGYRASTPVTLPDGSIEQYVEIEFVNRHTAATRSVRDRQLWRFEEASNRWFLHTGLPKIDAVD